MNDESPAFLKTFGLVSTIILLTIILFNLIVDPFGIFGTPTIPGVTQFKPRMHANIRMVKAHRVKRIQPHGLILGSSRAETGLDPNHPGWSESAKPVYNLALPSARIFEIFQYLKHAHAQAGLTQVVLGLDFFMFDPNYPSETGFEMARLDNIQSALPNLGLIEDYIMSLLSYDSLVASIDTLRVKNKINHYLENGSRNTENKHKAILIQGGYFSAFEKTIKSSLLSNDGLYAIEYGQKDGRKIEALKWFRNLVRFCVNNNIELYVLITPIHALWLELMWQLDHWNDYESWKRDVVNIVDAALIESKDQARIEFWDFSGFNEITQEVMPAKGDALSNMSWYWEASHYKRRAGNIMLDRALIGIKGAEFSEFGTQLTNLNIDAHLENIRKAHKMYQQSRPNEILYVKELIANTHP